MKFVEIDPDKARESFYIDEKWELVWKNRPRTHFDSNRSHSLFNTRFAGKVAGYDREFAHTSYRLIKFDGYKLNAHRLLWAVYYGENPVGIIDHIDGNGLNNNINNLRLCSPAENNLNSSKRGDFVGVFYNKRVDRWIARMRREGEKVKIRRFKNKEDAIKQRLEWEEGIIREGFRR